MGRPKANKTAVVAKAAANEKKSRGKRYSDEEKAQIIQQTLAEIAQGGQITKIAESLGVTFFTLKAWLAAAGHSVKSSGKRGRVKGSRKTAKGVVKQAAPAALSDAAVVPVKIPGKRGRKPGSKNADSGAAVRALEAKMEELTTRYTNLAHLYGELISKIGSPKL